MIFIFTNFLASDLEKCILLKLKALFYFIWKTKSIIYYAIFCYCPDEEFNLVYSTIELFFDIAPDMIAMWLTSSLRCPVYETGKEGALGGR